jgi:2-(1,2-epoxy-1,2-dihydrophenyl)acetyl-CoA isomerase
MIYETITYAETHNVGVITLNRPEVMNALSSQMRAELLHAVRQAGKSARVLVMTGAGRAFCSGQDLGDRPRIASIDLERTLRDEYEPLLRAIYDCPVPTISAVNGAAAGAGANLALAADVVIASETASFIQAFTRIGLIPDAGEFAAHWQARASHLAQGPTAAYRGVKTAIRASFSNDLEQQLALEARLQGACGQTYDFKEGVIAFLEKRAAKFEGR